jgi:hypothetical protein
MCGEVQLWQNARESTVRVTSGATTNIYLPVQMSRVMEVRLDEVFVTGFNGGVSGTAYVNMNIPNMTPVALNNEKQPGFLIGVDVLNPHVVFNRPKLLFKAEGATIQNFQMSVVLPTGATATFTELVLSLTFVMAKSADELKEVRMWRASVEPHPTIMDVRNTYNPSNGSF